MRRFSDLPEMPGDVGEMRCGGCAAKVGPLTLDAALARFGDGHGPRDDAAVIDAGGDEVRLETVDFFRSFWPDPFVLGRIAAHHAIGDVLAMGGEPRFAQAICVLPYARPRNQAEDLFQLLAGARAAFADAATMALVFDPQTAGGFLAGLPEDAARAASAEAGFAVIGRVERRGEGPPLRLAGRLPGLPPPCPAAGG